MIPLMALPWSVEFWPGQDDPNHLAIAHILQNFDEPGSPYPDYLTVNHDLTPYKLYYFLLLLFSQVVELDDANRIIVSLVIAALPLVMLFWLRRIAPERRINGFLVCLLATSWLPMIGFQTYMLSFLIGLATLALAVGKAGPDGTRQPPGWGALVGASALLFIAAIAHPVAPVMLGGALFVLEAPGRNGKAWLRLAVVGTPAALLLVITSFLSSSSGNIAGFVPLFPGVLTNLKTVLVNLIAFDRLEFLIRLPVLVVLLWAATQSIRRVGIRGQGRDQCLNRVFVVFLIAYFLVPNFPALGFLPTRIGFFLLMVAVLLPLPARVTRRPRLLCWSVALACIAAAAVQYRGASRLSEDVSEVVAAGQVIPRGATVLPLRFEGQDHGARVGATLHAWGYLVQQRDIVTPYLFANGSGMSIAGGGWRPVTYSQPFGPEFLPYVQESLPETWVKYGRFISGSAVRLMKELMLETMAGYDRVILLSPPEEFVEEALQTMEAESHVGDVWVLKPIEDGPAADDPD